MEPDWPQQGQGERPEIAWSFSLDAPLTAFALARESGEIVAVDSSGGLYLLDRRGRVKSLTRGFKSLGALAWSDTGTCGAAVTGFSKLSWIDHALRVKWSRNLRAEILSLAVDAHGHFLAVSLAGGETLLFDTRKKKKEVSRFKTIRPLKYLKFVASQTRLLGAAEYGLVGCHRLDGSEVWSERLWSNVGDLTVTGDGEEIFLARFNQGVQKLNRSGHGRGSYQVGGTPNHVSTSFVPGRLAVTTVERDIYWLDADGLLLWATHLPDDVCGIAVDALGRGLTCGFQSGRIYRLDWSGDANQRRAGR